MANIGSIIDKKYEIITEIGRGGMSVVYLALDRRLNKQWAVKEIKKQVNDSINDIVIQSLITEANLMKRLDHPALPRIVDIIDDGHTIYVVMDYIEGTSLDVVLKKEGTIPQETVIEWAKQLCDALNYLHNQNPPIIYRDMKPANVMLKPEGTLKIVDFGIAREYKQENIADTVCLGTKGYAAPEQFGGQGQTDARTDIYGLGITLYQLITGKNPTEPPYEIYPIRYWNPALSGGLENVITKCVQLNPEDRYQNCDELMYALEHYEEIDDIYVKQQKKKVVTCAVMLMVTILLLISGTFFNYRYSVNNTSRYEELIATAEKTMDGLEAQKLYQEAVELIPDRTEAYEGLITLYKENDSAFSADEANVLVGLVNANKNVLYENLEGYVQLCYEIGKMYWFHYDYGNTEDNQLTRIKSAIPWFEDVVSICEENAIEYANVNIARIMRDIGIFNKNYSINIREASGKGTYEEYYRQLEALTEFLETNQDEDELVIWEAYKVIAYSLELYLQKFKSDGITGEAITGFVNRLYDNIMELDATDEMTIEIQGYVLERLDITNGMVIKKIQEVY